MVEDQDQIVRFNNTFPPGFRFHPSDEELIVYYLKKKINSLPLPAPIVAEIDLYKFNPWDLPESLVWRGRVVFLQPRDRKYPNGLRPNRAAGCGYWKATGTDKPVLTRCGSKLIGVKKALVFYSGRPPKATKTNWIMNEYRLVDTTRKPSSRFKGSMRLDDWVLCRVRYKGYPSNQRGENQENHRCGSKLTLPTITDYQIFASVSPQMTIPSLDYGCFDSLKRTSNEDSQRGNLISFDSSCRPNPENKIDNLPDSNCYSSQSLFNEGILIGQRILGPSINFQEPNELPFTAGRFMQ